MQTGWRRMIARAALGLAAVTLILVIFALTPGGLVGAQADTYPLEVGATSCQQTPATLAPPELARAGCVPAPGVTIVVRDADGQPRGECVTRPAPGTELIATCTVEVPFDTVLHFAEDSTTIPSGFAPLATELFERSPPRGVPGYPPQFFINVPAAENQPVASPAPPGGELSITVKSYTCAPGVTAATVPAGCTPASEGFSVVVASLEGVAEPLDLGDATPVDDAYVLGDEALRSRGLFGRLAIAVTGLPPGYSDYLVVGDAVTFDAALGQYVLRLPLDAPRAEVIVYALVPGGESLAGVPGSTAGRELAILAGSCEALGPEMAAAPLVDVTPPQSEAAGHAGVLQVEAWQSTLSLPLAIMTGQTYALELRAAEGDRGNDAGVEPIACGDVPGSPVATGAFSVAIHGVASPDSAGIAYLSPAPADQAQTDVVIFLAEGRAGAGTPTTE